MSNYTKYLSTYYGKRLLGMYTLKDYGIWEVRGEDPNCDLGGCHHNPYLGTYEGYLGDILTTAVDLPGFWYWGAGGEIVKVSIQKADPTAVEIRNKAQRAKLKKLEDEVLAIKTELGMKI